MIDWMFGDLRRGDNTIVSQPYNGGYNNWKVISFEMLQGGYYPWNGDLRTRIMVGCNLVSGFGNVCNNNDNDKQGIFLDLGWA